MASGFYALAYFFFLKSLLTTYAQSTPSVHPVPPLQWLNITGLLQGTPAPVKYASMGFNAATGTLIVFGGESSSGIATDQTFLLDLAKLSWNSPQPQAGLPQGAPPARYMAVGGEDISSSYRNAHLVMGGKGGNGKPLSDAWEFDYTNQFWSQVTLASGGPPARWGASGGRDYSIQANVTTGSNTFYMSGGTDGTTMYSLSDVWELSVSGTLSPNLATDNTNGTWSSHTPLGNASYSINQASTVVQTTVISVSGCNTTDDSSESCAEGNSYILNVGSNSDASVPACPVPRYGGALVSNMNPNFSTQVFLLLGTFNLTLWDDQGGLLRGEVAILDIGTGDWIRVLPAGDPGVDGVQTYPTPREGAVALSYPQALVGSGQNVGSDTIVFGGQDESGEYLTEVWILRAYNGSISSSNGSWGAPTGALSTGINANGAGVTIQYMSQCAVQLMSATSTPTSSSSPSASSSNPSSSYQAYRVSFSHKLLAPLSVAILLPSILVLRLALPPVQIHRATNRNIALFYLSAVLALAAYGAGVGGLISSFTSISFNVVTVKRSISRPNLQTVHGIAGLALFIALYVIVPFLFLLFLCCSRARSPKEVTELPPAITSRANSTDTAEKLAAYGAAQHSQYPPSSHSPRARLHSWGGSSFWLSRRSREGRASTDSESMHSSGPQRAFEVVNRPARTRRSSTNGLVYSNTDVYQRVPVAPRSLGDVDWLDRRRSPNAVNELDFVSSHGQRGLVNLNNSAPNGSDLLSTGPLMPTPRFPRTTHELPPPLEMCIRILFHAFVLALCILSLIALWYQASQVLFAVFLSWTVTFYICLFTLAWRGRPRKSILTSLVAKLRAEPLASGSLGNPPSRPLSAVGTEQYPFPTDTRGPYLHEPPYRTARGHDDMSTTIEGPRSVEADYDDDDIDEETRQRRIEDEMGRREVSIVTVPKRKLWITNPS